MTMAKMKLPQALKHHRSPTETVNATKSTLTVHLVLRELGNIKYKSHREYPALLRIQKERLLLQSL